MQEYNITTIKEVGKKLYGEIPDLRPSYYALSSSARSRYLDDLLNEPSERRIISIVKSTIAPNVITPQSILKEYTGIHPAIHGYSVRGGNSGRAERRTLNRFEPISWELPGQGAIGNPGECDRAHGSEACTDSEKGRNISLTLKRWYCDRPTCPECYEHWTNTTPKLAVRTLKGARRLFEFYGSKYRLCHVVISSPPEYSKYIGIRKGYDLLMEDFYRVADAFNMHGFMIFHPWRGGRDEDSDKTLVITDNDLSEFSDNNGDYWKLGPHVHLIAFCDPDRIISSSEEFYNQTGFVIKVIAQDMEDDYAENVISYALSHCGIGHWEGHKDLKTLHPFGYMATSKDNGVSVLTEVIEEVPKTCAECGGFIYDTKELDLRLPEEDLIPQTVKLHHLIFVRRRELAGYRITIEGMNDAELLEYARSIPYDLALIYDDRPTVIEAKCNVPKVIEDDMNAVLHWRRPRGRGQTNITPFEKNPRGRIV